MSITKKSLVTAILVILIICISKITYASTGVVTADLLNLRESPSTSAKVKATLKKNQEMEIIEQNDKWYKVKINGVEGYVHGDYIKVKEEPKVDEQKEEPVTQKEEDKKTENDTKLLETITVSKEVDIYILPLINATKISKTVQNEVVTVLGSTNKWLFVSSKSVNGWILRSAVSDSTSQNSNTTTNTESNNNENNNNNNSGNNTNQNTEVNNQNNNNTQTIEPKTMYVNVASIYVRKGPGTNYEYVDTLILNNDVTVIGEEGDWYKVKVNGKEGYIAKWLLSNKVTSRGEVNRSSENNENSNMVQASQSSNVTTLAENTTSNEKQTAATSSVGQQIVDYAKQFLGCKYVYGGSGPNTFDCSGFTMYVYSKFGISLSHSAVTQAKKGTYVAKEDLQPGDLVFFKNYDTMVGIGHCGIYIGNGDFIHASSGTGYCVKISTLLTGHYETRYETARRVL